MLYTTNISLELVNNLRLIQLFSTNNTYHKYMSDMCLVPLIVKTILNSHYFFFFSLVTLNSEIEQTEDL